MNEFVIRLQRRFQAQVTFAAAYSPLYARFFAVCAEWLNHPDDGVARWLVQTGQMRNPFDVPLLLAAAIHRDVLVDEPAAYSLAAYYPTAGGTLPPEDGTLPALWHDLILARAEAYTPFIQTATVQTNETGRGLAWLWPLLHTGWREINLVDLGASAGLNLVAEQRAYRLLNTQTDIVLADLGLGQPVQFVTNVVNGNEMLSHHENAPRTTHHVSANHILSRTGCDLHPFILDSPARELTLMSFIWGDQPHRLERLREGIAAWHEVARHTPIHLWPVDLPDELPTFLQRIPANDAPVLLYNTWMTTYLKDKGAALRQHIGRWAAAQQRPVLWVQWEPLHGGPEPPEYGWCAWLVDLWQGGEHDHWQLGWVHPHGTVMQVRPELATWLDKWRGA